jgi:hypothetical protein
MQTISDLGITYGSPNLMAADTQHLDIAASIASNAITVTLNPCTLSFRSTTLTSGTPSIVSTATQLSLTIASTDSFGLVTAAGSQRIVILCVNDSGTLRLAASALYGGVNLDETGVITTATTATLSSNIKCGAVATSKAYRVVGFVDATFTTSTGWGSLVTVQPVGGQALTALSSLGYGQTWQNVTGSRAFGTTYYNTTGKPLMVNITTTTTGSVNTATVNGVTAAQTYPSTNSWGTLAFVVPPGASYIVSSGSSLQLWSELR